MYNNHYTTTVTGGSYLILCIHNEIIFVVDIKETYYNILQKMDALEVVQRHEDYNGKRIILIAATNVPENIDPALLRPGRFDRLIYVPVPDERARKQILQNIRKEMGDYWGEDVDVDALVRLTPFLTGADVRNLCSKAALEAFREKNLLEDDDTTMILFRHFQKVIENRNKLRHLS